MQTQTDDESSKICECGHTAAEHRGACKAPGCACQVWEASEEESDLDDGEDEAEGEPLPAT